jgi:hypothetical protein
MPVNKKSREQFEEELLERNPNVKLVGEFVNMSTKTEFECEKGHWWHTTPNSVWVGHGCARCKGVYQKTHEQFLREMASIHPDIVVLGTYVGDRIKIEVQCQCGRVWQATPSSLLQGSGCRPCSGRAGQQGKKDKALARVQQVLDNQGQFEIISKYTDFVTPITLRCKNDGHEFEIWPQSINRSKSPKCPVCSRGRGSGTKAVVEKPRAVKRERRLMQEAR